MAHAETSPYGLTKKEVAIVRLVANGYTNAEIAALQWVAVQTVKFHLTHVMAKVDCRNRVEVAVRWAREQEA